MVFGFAASVAGLGGVGQADGADVGKEKSPTSHFSLRALSAACAYRIKAPQMALETTMVEAANRLFSMARHIRKVSSCRLNMWARGGPAGTCWKRLWPDAIAPEPELQPERCPHWGDRMPPGVPLLPARDIKEFTAAIVSRYEATLLTYPPLALAYALANPRWKLVSEQVFCDMLTRTAFSKFLTPKLDAEDLAAFAPWLVAAPGTSFLKIDFSAMSLLDPLPGTHAAPTVTLFRRMDDGTMRPLAIRIGKLLLTPDDVNAWQRARLFVMQGAVQHLINVVHPQLHFPLDAVNAITRLVFPPTHPLRRLLAPHLRFTLALDAGVRFHSRSVAWNDQSYIYTPFTAPRENIFELFSIGYTGMPGNSAYPAWRYSLDVPTIHSDYETYLRGYHRVILRFVERAVAGIRPGDVLVQKWADRIARWVPGFPSGDAIFQDGNLGRVLAMFILSVTVMHSADHHDYGGGEISAMPIRLRIRPPQRKDEGPLDLGACSSIEDVFRYRMAWKMFFAPATMTHLGDTDYGFDPQSEPELVAANQQFLRELRAWDRQMPCRRYAPLADIARSIQY